MSDPKRGQLSSAFDDLLARNWQQFDALGGRPRRAEAAPSVTASGAAEAPTMPAPPPLANDTDVARALDAAFPGGWRYEVVDRRRAGDEAVVTCRLTVDESGRETVQQGRAPLGAARRLGGSSGGIAFSIAVAGDGEAAAFAAATEAALAACQAQI